MFLWNEALCRCEIRNARSSAVRSNGVWGKYRMSPDSNRPYSSSLAVRFFGSPSIVTRPIVSPSLPFPGLTRLGPQTLVPFPWIDRPRPAPQSFRRRRGDLIRPTSPLGPVRLVDVVDHDVPEVA